MDGWMEGWREAGREGGMGEGEDDAPNPPVPEPAVGKHSKDWMDWWREGWTCGEGCMDLWICMSIWILGYYKSEMQQCRRVRVLSAQLVFTWLGGGAKHAAWWRGKSCLAGRVVRFHGLIGSLAGCAEHESLPTNQQTRTPMSAPFTTLGVTKSRRGYWSGRRFIRLVSRSEWKASTSLLTCFSTIRSKGVISVGQRSSPWPCNSVKLHGHGYKRWPINVTSNTSFHGVVVYWNAVRK